MTTPIITWGKRHGLISLYMLLGLILIACSSFFLSNRYRLASVLGFTPPKDIRNITVRSDDPANKEAHWFSFECTDTTIDYIKKKLQLSAQASVSGAHAAAPQPAPEKATWWDNSFADKATPLVRIDNMKQAAVYLWYNAAKRKAYLFSYDF